MASDINHLANAQRSITEKLDKILDVVPFVAEIRREMDDIVLPAVKTWNEARIKTAKIAIAVSAGGGVTTAGAFPLIKALFLRFFS